MDCDLLHTIQLDVIFNFARYEELREAVQQLQRDNFDGFIPLPQTVVG